MKVSIETILKANKKLISEKPNLTQEGIYINHYHRGKNYSKFVSKKELNEAYKNAKL